RGGGAAGGQDGGVAAGRDPPGRGRTGVPTAGRRILVSAAAGVVALVVAAFLLPWQPAVLIGWDVTALLTVARVLGAVTRRDSAATAALATREDDSRTAADLVVLLACVASLVGVGFNLLKGAQEKGGAEAALTALSVATVVLSWAAVQTVFTLRYAHLYYSQGGGVDFNEDDNPDYRDFAYLALTIGMTYQVSDTDLTKKAIRRTASRHALISYVFGTFVVAVTINVVAGLVK
ncbi:MAG: DUF1345 domain-containing protein, partial [Acidimicrobiales bacterium]